MQTVNSLTIATCILLLSLLTSCTVLKDRALFTAPTDIIMNTITEVHVVNDLGLDNIYRIKAHDLLAIRNIQNKEFGATNMSNNTSYTSNTQNGIIPNVISYEVPLDGNVNLPAIGKVGVVGLNRIEAAFKIQELYKLKLLPDPIIELCIVNLKVTLLGEFNRQGNYLLQRDNITLIDIIGEAGGITKNADPKTLKIIRGDKSHPELIYVNMSDINSLASKKLVLQNNDIIVLLPSKGSAMGDKLQTFNNILQPMLVVANLAVLIFTLTR